MHHFDFKHKPPYYALSYTWGPNYNQQPITVNSQTFKVSPNLFCFLALAFDIGINSDMYLWIDQICIDQSENAFGERADQVAMMDKIYADAEQVVVWLGVGDPDIERFLDLVEKPDAIVALNSEHQRAYNAFYRLPYWERGWIVQEMYFARRLRLTYGTRSATVEEVDKAEKRFLAYTYGSHIHDGFTTGQFIQMLETEMDMATDLTFIANSFLLRQRCGRIHDRIYAFQSLIPVDSRIEVNYEWTPLQLFNALLDKLGETALDHGVWDIEVFANRLDILPEDFRQTLRRLNKRFRLMSHDEQERRERSYKEWAPRRNPACRSNETWARRMLLMGQDGWDLIRNNEVKPSYPSSCFWSDAWEHTD